MAGTDFSHLTNDELIKGIKALDLPDYIRSKAYGIDVRETLAQMTEMTIQLGVNMGLSPDDALLWARKLQQSVSQSEFDSWVATLLDGGPSLFFETKAALVAEHPNGAPGVALVRETDPAKIYVWNGTVWEDFGDYQGIEVKDGTISTPKIANGAVTDAKLDQSLFESFAVSMHYQITVGNLVRSKYFPFISVTKSAYSRFTPKNNILYKVYMDGGNIEEAAWFIGGAPIDKGSIVDLLTVETKDGDVIPNVSTMETLSVSDYNDLTNKGNQIYRVFKNSGEESAWYYGSKVINRAYTGYNSDSFSDFLTGDNEEWRV